MGSKAPWKWSAARELCERIMRLLVPQREWRRYFGRDERVVRAFETPRTRSRRNDAQERTAFVEEVRILGELLLSVWREVQVGRQRSPRQFQHLLHSKASIAMVPCNWRETMRMAPRQAVREVPSWAFRSRLCRFCCLTSGQSFAVQTRSSSRPPRTRCSRPN